MPQPVIPPACVPFLGSINGLAAGKSGEPREGRKTVQANVLWSKDGGSNAGIIIDLGSATIVTISQIKCLYIDNSNCGVPLIIWFSDTQQRIIIPPQTVGYYPVVTNLLYFNVWCSITPSATDYTIINVLNFDQRPIEYTSLTPAITTDPYFNSLTLTLTQTYTLDIAAVGGSFIITDMQLNIAGSFNAGCVILAELKDHSNKILSGFEMFNSSSATLNNFYQVLCEQHSMTLVSSNGLQMVVTVGSAACSANLLINMQIVTL